MFDPIEYINTPSWQTVSLGLSRISELLNGLDRPQDSLRFVHVAGTNGKGSTCAFVASVLERAGYRVGLFTSPALYCFEDRLRVNGVNITSDELLRATQQVREVADVMDEHPSEFELLTAVAFCHFVHKDCDIVVTEVGLGGRLDSTNVIDTPEVSVITPISFDHCSLLGDTLPAIAREKAGIIKPGVPVVSAPQESCVLEVIKRVARSEHTTVEVVDPSRIMGTETDFSYKERSGLSLGLSGSFQLTNAACALDTIDVLKRAGWSISETAIREGLRAAVWPGRFETVSEDPLIIFDGGHNVSGMEALARSLDQAYPDCYRIVLTGVLADKDYETMAHVLAGFADEVFTVTPSNSRALSADDYAHVLENVHDGQMRSVTVAADIASGVKAVLRRSDEVNKEYQIVPLICVCGSLYLLGSVMEVLRQVKLVL